MKMQILFLWEKFEEWEKSEFTLEFWSARLTSSA
jgi:hypothetical protein